MIVKYSAYTTIRLLIEFPSEMLSRHDKSGSVNASIALLHLLEFIVCVPFTLKTTLLIVFIIRFQSKNVWKSFFRKKMSLCVTKKSDKNICVSVCDCEKTNAPCL